MKTICTLFIILFFSVTNARAQSANDHATVYFMRSTGVAGMGAFSIFIDKDLVCRLNNNSYSTHKVAPGLHKMQIRGSGQKPKERLTTLDIEMEAGQTYYVSVDAVNTPMTSQIFLLEVTVNTANMKMKMLEPDKNCK